MRRPLSLLLCLFLVGALCSYVYSGGRPRAYQAARAGAADYPQPRPVTGKPGEFPVRKTEAEWRRQLTPAQYHILREQGTERPYANKYFDNHATGSYYCAADHHLLFTSERKFESGTGWPSFWAPAAAGSVKVKSDRSLGMSRDEIVCAQCGGHLGHLFDDGPKPTGQRYCMDSEAMLFEPAK